MKTLTVPEVAAELGIDAQTVRAQIRAGKLDAQKHGRDWLVEQRAVDRYRAEHLGRPGRRAAE